MSQAHVKHPSATFFQKDSTLAMIQRQAIPLIKIMQGTLSSERDVGIAITLFLEWCNRYDWQLRLQWLQSYLNSTQQSCHFDGTCNVAQYSFQAVLDSHLFKQLYSVYEILEDKYMGR